MNVNRILAALVVTGSMTLVPTTARGEAISFEGLGNASVVRLGGMVNEYVYAGELNWSFTGTAPDGFNQSFYSYCVDVLHDLQPAQTVSAGGTGDLNGGAYAADGGARAAWLFNTFAGAAHVAGASVQAAALQVAIWEALYDSTLDLAAGNIQLTWANAAVMAQAATYLQALALAPYQGSGATVLLTTGGQSQITVPEPATVLLIGMGLGLFLLLKKKVIGFNTN